jgi:5-methylcytosine-specific restriction endonuclease McrA
MKDLARKSSMECGDIHYWNGKPCLRGHVGPRQTSNTFCLACRALWNDGNREKLRVFRRKWRDGNPEKSIACTKAWATKNPDRVKAKARRLHAINKDLYNERSRQWQKENSERFAARSKAWKRANPEKVCAYSSKRRATKLSIGGKYSGEDVKRIRAAQGNKCAYCRVGLKGVKVHIDHITPLSLGGSNGAENIQILCVSCNLSKGALHPVDFAQRIGRLL